MMETCPHCYEEFTPGPYMQHVRICVYADAMYAQVRAILEDADNPGYIVAENVYDRRRAAHSARLPSGATMRGTLGHGWAGVAKFFTLKLCAAALDHMHKMEAAKAEPRLPPVLDLDARYDGPQRSREADVRDASVLHGYVEHDVRCFDAVAHTWVTLHTIAIR